MHTFTTEPHPTCKGKVLARILPPPRCPRTMDMFA